MHQTLYVMEFLYFCAMKILQIILLIISLAGNFVLMILYLHSRWSYHKLMNKSLKEESRKDELVDKFLFEDLPVESNRDKMMLDALQKLMEEEKVYLNPSLGIEELAKMVGTNKTYLSHVINRSFQQNFPSFVNRYRVREAIRLLSDNSNFNRSIEEIGELCGYTTRQAFHSAFKKEMGITPRHFRNINRSISMPEEPTVPLA